MLYFIYCGKHFQIKLNFDILLYMNKKKRKQPNLGQLIIPVGNPNPPEPHEVDAAKVLAQHYQTTVEFLVPVDDYKRKSADIKMLGTVWEIKSPIGGTKSTIQNQFRRASKQAKNIILDIRRTKLNYETIDKRVRFELQKHPYLKKVILIDNFENVIEIQK